MLPERSPLDPARIDAPTNAAPSLALPIELGAEAGERLRGATST